MKTLIFLGFLVAGYSSYEVIKDPLPNRLYGNQCKDVCRIADACSFDDVPTALPCNIGTRRSDCCEYIQH